MLPLRDSHRQDAELRRIRSSASNAIPNRPEWGQQPVARARRRSDARRQPSTAVMQNAALRDALLATRGSITAYGFPFWVKWNAVLLERIREELRPAAERDEAALAERKAAMAAYHDSA